MGRIDCIRDTKTHTSRGPDRGTERKEFNGLLGKLNIRLNLGDIAEYPFGVAPTAVLQQVPPLFDLDLLCEPLSKLAL